MSRATDASLKRMAAAERRDWDEVSRLEAAEAAAKPKAVRAKQDGEKPIGQLIAESDWYDWLPQARALLREIALMAMKEDSSYPDDAPAKYKADKVGWCWLSQHRLGLRVGIDESTVWRWIQRFREDGVIEYRDWYDDNNTHHAEYKIVVVMFEAHQRPSQKPGVERPKRYANRPKNNQQRAANGTFAGATRRAILEEDDE